MSETVVIIDDDERFRAAARMLLSSRGFAVVADAPDGLSGMSAVDVHRPTYVLIDMQLPDIDGHKLSEHIGRTHPATRIILTSNDADLWTEAPSSAHFIFLAKEQIADSDLRALFSKPDTPT